MNLRALALTGLVFSLAARADEGMWTFDNLPLKAMKDAYGFAPDAAWLEHARLAALSFGGGSGSFISPEGLAITNHHVGRGWVQQVSGPGDKDYIKLGFIARTRDQEIKIPGATLRTLMQMENVTSAVQGSVTPNMSEREAAAAREKALEQLRKDLAARTKLEVSAVTLYQGGEYWLYAYKVHTDIRLVMAPEMGIAFFGGDSDNFSYPRHNLDFTLFRVYEDGKPYRPKHHLTWSKAGVQADELTFVVGHPGRTQRQLTVAHKRYLRDVQFPISLASLESRRAALQAFAAKSPEHARQVNTQIFGIENSLKASRGYWEGLKRAEAFAELEKAETEFRTRVAQDAKLQAEAGSSWGKIEAALAQFQMLAKERAFLFNSGSNTLNQAVALVRLVEAAAKPEAQRPKGFRTEEEFKRIKTLLGRPPRGGANPELETLTFERTLEDVKAQLAPEHPYRKAVLSGSSPAEAAKAVISSQMKDAAFRDALIAGGPKALAACTDPMIRMALRVAPLLEAMETKQENIDAILEEHNARIAKARFAVYGKSLYPDATGTLRLTYGPIKGFPGLGTHIQPFTTFLGLYDRALGHGPKAENGAWALPPRWIERKQALNLETPFNFVHAVDIIGGNSGSPVLNTKGEFVGVIFDGNIDMLPGNFYYDGTVNRGVTLDGRAILESLVKVYDAQFLVDEIAAK